MQPNIYRMNFKKTATTIEQQLEKLQTRGMIFENGEKAMENLLDIGYFRLGFYWFPFECTYPRKDNRNHKLKPDTKFEFIIQLYYFDFDLRNILLRYISRIEINFRTQLIYMVSNKYCDNPFWYVDKAIIDESYINDKKYKAALTDTKKEEVIKRDLRNHHDHEYAPAWKTIEYLSFGNVIQLYDNLKDGGLKAKIAKSYGIQSPNQFSNYINTIRRLRNYCAHGKVLFDINFPEAISTSGPAGNLGARKTMLSGAYMVLQYILGRISLNRTTDMDRALYRAFEIIEYEEVKAIIRDNSGIDFSNLKK